MGVGPYREQKVELDAGDIEIGAVEVKNSTSDVRAEVGPTAGVVEGDNVLGVQAPVLGATTGAAVITDANGTLQQYSRGLVAQMVNVLARLDVALSTRALEAGGNLATLATRMDAVLSTRAAEAGGNLAAINGKIPNDPAKESGNLSTILTLLVAQIRHNNTYAPIQVAIGAASVLSVALAAGCLYILTCDCSCAFIAQDVGVAAAATANSRKLWAGTYRLHYCNTAGIDDGISCITLVGGTTGTLSIERIA